jgi:hypothetical protein
MSTASKPTIVLVTNRSDFAFELRDIQRFADGSGLHCEMFVRCHGFSAQRPFYCSEGSFRAALSALRRMDEQLQGKARFDEEYEHYQFLELAMLARGHVLVSGQLVLVGEHTNRFSFAFETDQTCLSPLIRSLDALNQ